jgi:hypothetical protein
LSSLIQTVWATAVALLQGAARPRRSVAALLLWLVASLAALASALFGGMLVVAGAWLALEPAIGASGACLVTGALLGTAAAIFAFVFLAWDRTTLSSDHKPKQP